MGKRLYVGNLPYSISDGELQQLFEQHGSVASAQVVMDRDTGRSKGFGFVEMGSDQEAQAAIAAMSGKEVDGRQLTVNEAKPREDRGGGGGGRGYGGGGGGGYGGGRGGSGGGRRGSGPAHRDALRRNRDRSRPVQAVGAHRRRATAGECLGLCGI